MQAIDDINRKSEGRGVMLASEGQSDVKSLSQHRSPRYTTSWDELPIVKL